MKRKYSLALMLSLMLLASALTCLVMTLAGRGVVFNVLQNENSTWGREFTTLLNVIEEMYIGEYEVGRISEAAMRAAVYELGDRWSYYMTEEEYAGYINRTQNQFPGIGVSIIIDDDTGGMRIIDIYRNSPAHIAGLLAGDVIIGIDGGSVTGFSTDEMRAILARPLGETAELSVIREDGTVELIEVIYEMVFSSPVSFDMLDGDIGYISITNFEGGCADEFISAVDQLIEQGALAFVFDVRSNGGGRVNEMTRILDYLLPEGEIFVSVSKNGKEEVTWSDSEMIDMPAVVIVNKYSYSAAEYFAATLREFDYAQIVGENTTGKSRSQRTEVLPGGGALHISFSQYLTKNRVALYDVGGVKPDHVLVLSDEEYSLLSSKDFDYNSDPQIMLAVSVVK